MDLIRDIEDSDDELIVRGAEGSGPVLFYTGLTGVVAGIGFTLFDDLFGQIAIMLSVATAVVGFVLAKRQTSLEIHHDEDLLTTEDSRWTLQDAVAVVLAPRRRVPDYIDEPSQVTEETGTHLWRAWLFAASDFGERQTLLDELNRLHDEAGELHALELDERLEQLGGEVFMQMPNPENPARAAARAASHLDVPLFDFALDSAPRLIEDVQRPAEEVLKVGGSSQAR